MRGREKAMNELLFQLTVPVSVLTASCKCAPRLATRDEPNYAAEVRGNFHISWDFYLQYLVVGQRYYILGTPYTFLLHKSLALCTFVSW